MARIRSIHPDALKSDKLAALSPEAERCWWRLITHLDDEGRGEDDPGLLSAYLFPKIASADERAVDGWLAEMATVGLLVRYEHKGKRYLGDVYRWGDYQKPQRPTPSRVPKPPRVLRESSASPQGVLPIGEGGEVGGEIGEGEDLAPTPARRDVLFEAVAEACGVDWTALTPSARGSLNKAVKEIRATNVLPADLWVSEVHRRAGEYRVRFPDAALTPPALAKHWPSLNGDAATMSGGKGAILRAAAKLLPGST